MQELTCVALQQQPSTSNTIYIDNPEKHGEGVKDAYVTFDIHYNKHTVKRRYQDFCWLHERLIVEVPTVILPPLPDRHSLLDMLMDRFSPDFIVKRQFALQRYLQRLDAHPLVKESRVYGEFLTKEYLGQEQSEASSDTTLPSSDTPLTAPGTIPDADSLAKWQSTATLIGTHSDSIGHSLHRLVKAGSQLATSWQDSAAAHDRLASVLDLEWRSRVERKAAQCANEARRLDKLVPLYI